MVIVTCEAIWLKRLLKDLQVEVSDPTTMYCVVFHTRTKHIEVHYHFVREWVLSSEVELVYVPTDRQTADIFTKPLGLDKLRPFSSALCLHHLDIPILRRRISERSTRRDDKV